MEAGCNTEEDEPDSDSTDGMVKLLYCHNWKLAVNVILKMNN